MNAYQNFLNFFSMHNKERLDGLSENYFIEMTPEERRMAFDYLLKRVETGGTEESVNGLFRADSNRAVEPIKRFLANGTLNRRAQISAAWNLYQINGDKELLLVFIRLMADTDPEVRGKAAYYVPSNQFTNELKSALQGMIRTETELTARIHAVDKLLECYRVTEESVGKEKYLSLYKALHNENIRGKERAFIYLEKLHEQAR